MRKNAGSDPGVRRLRFNDRVGSIDGQALYLLALTGWPLDDQAADAGIFAEPKGQGRVGLRQVTELRAVSAHGHVAWGV